MQNRLEALLEALAREYLSMAIDLLRVEPPRLIAIGRRQQWKCS
jgi:hypothetical protein